MPTHPMSRRLTWLGQLQRRGDIPYQNLGLGDDTPTQQDLQLLMTLHEFLAGAHQGGHLVEIPDLEGQILDPDEAAMSRSEAFQQPLVLPGQTNGGDGDASDEGGVEGADVGEEVEAQERELLIHPQVQGAVEDGHGLVAACPACAEELYVSRPARDELREVSRHGDHGGIVA